MLIKISTKHLGFISIISCSMMSAFAFAESSVAERFMEEVVVRAEKKESTLQSTPIAITAITEQEIEKRGIRTMHDVQYMAPGVTFNPPLEPGVTDK